MKMNNIKENNVKIIKMKKIKLCNIFPESNSKIRKCKNNKRIGSKKLYCKIQVNLRLYAKMVCEI